MSGTVPEKYQSASEIADLVTTREISAVEILDRYLNQINEHEEDVHAFNLVTIKEARAAAKETDRLIVEGEKPGPLAGVPVAIKDNLCTKGIPTTASSNILEGWKPPYDATVVKKLKEAGATIVDIGGESTRPGSKTVLPNVCLLYTSPSPRDGLLSRMPSSA